MLKVTVNGNHYEYNNETTYLQIAKDVQSQYEHDILLAMQDGVLVELNKTVDRDGEITFITSADKAGMRAYHMSTVFLFMKALNAVSGRYIDNIWVHFSVRKGLLVEVTGDVTVDQDLVERIKDKMRYYVSRAIKLEKNSESIRDVVKRFEAYGMQEKTKIFKYRRNSKVNIYRMEKFEDYYYGYMVPDTSYLKYFDICLYKGYLILQLPEASAPEVVPPFEVQDKLYQAQLRSVEWRKMMEVNTVADLNHIIENGKIQDLILVQEALQESRLASIAQTIAEKPSVKFVMIAGPSSSGKTTTSRRLCIQLRAHGMNPHPISVDNYFVDRDQTPVDANGELDFECLEALDVELFNKQMCELLEGKEIEMPTFNFKQGVKEYRGDYLKLGPNDILVIEGIHALNDAMSYKLPKESKFKIYLSALTQLNIDEHNRVPTTDGRLLRRMVRDARTRGTSAKDTIHRWPGVRAGEENNIFPYQEDADVVFDSSQIYEMAALKVHAEPLLYQIPMDTPEGMEAKRMLKFLEYFLPIGAESIPINSIVREFVGGSCFDV